jgi:hypothetical protein
MTSGRFQPAGPDISLDYGLATVARVCRSSQIMSMAQFIDVTEVLACAMKAAATAVNQFKQGF